ncbi:hypothetical protein [Rhodococcus sp. 114MFTsu3.1]|nr:hypothetical protein [Rhodococcus sp. 114MFTsu3.1]
MSRIEHCGALDLIDAYGSGRRSLIYADPPYIGGAGHGTTAPK